MKRRNTVAVCIFIVCILAVAVFGFLFFRDVGPVGKYCFEGDKGFVLELKKGGLFSYFEGMSAGADKKVSGSWQQDGDAVILEEDSGGRQVFVTDGDGDLCYQADMSAGFEFADVPDGGKFIKR